MSARTGGPAFPVGEKYQTNDLAGNTTKHSKGALHDGMTLRDYFAIRAPDEIPTWFVYTHPTEKPAIPEYRKELPKELHEQWRGLDEWLQDKDVSAEVLAFRDRYDAAKKAVAEWNNAAALGMYIAWRWAYADAMLAAREAS